MVKKHRKYVFALFLLLLLINPLYSQITQSHSIVIGFLQIKDQLNLGMVFNGVQLEYRYGLLWKIQDHEILYQPKLGIGAGFNRGMTGFEVKIAPVNFTWTMPVYEQNGHTIRVGTNFSTDYNYQMYPSLNDAHLFWTSELGLSPVVRYLYQWDSRRFAVGIQNSLIGFTSHIQKYDPHFYSLTAKDFFVTPHRDLKFGSFNNYNHTNVSLEFVPNIDKMHSFVYEFDYFGIFYGPRFDRINHNLLWRMSL